MLWPRESQPSPRLAAIFKQNGGRKWAGGRLLTIVFGRLSIIHRHVNFVSHSAAKMLKLYQAV